MAIAIALVGAVIAAPAAASAPSEPKPASSDASADKGKKAGTPPPEPTYSNEQLVTADLDSSGLPKMAQLINRITTVDKPAQTIAPVTATSDVRFVDRTGAPKIQGNTVVLPIGGPGTQSTTTQATFGKPLPVALHAEYVSNGHAVDPETLLGTGGTVTVRYTATNTVVQKQTLHYEDADGNPITKEEPVFAPFAGAIRVVLPSGSQLISAPDSVANTIGDGQTELLWNLVLYPPMGNYQQTVELTMSAESLRLPDLQLEVTPVIGGQDPFAAFAANMLEESSNGNVQMVDGLTKLDGATAQLASGAGSLAEGLDELTVGTSALAKGEAELAAGTGKSRKASAQLTAGTMSLTSGLSKLSAGLDQMAGANGLPATVSGTQALITAVDEIVRKVGSKSDPPIPWPPDPSAVTLIQALRATQRGALALNTAADGLAAALAATAAQVAALGTSAATVSSNAGTAKSKAQSAYVAAGCGGGAPPAFCSDLQDAVNAAGDAETGADAIEAAITAPVAGISAQLTGEQRAASGISDGLGLMSAALLEIITGAEDLSEALKATTPGAASIHGGLVELKDALQKAADAAGQLSAGATTAESGSKQIAGGQGELTKGLGALELGADKLASGANKVNSGAEKLASGGNELSSGAKDLQTQGTSKMLSSVVEASKDPAMANAYLAASANMVGSAPPYPPPTGATGRIAYVYSLKAPLPRPAVDWPLVILGILALTAIATLAAIRIRRPGEPEPHD